MIVFNSDLDNTIIYSYKHDIGEDKKCVEIYQGREISFVTNQTSKLLKQVRKQVEMVPTTTRTIEQYERINLGTGQFRYALVCNGGILLVDGKEDDEWYKESLNLISGCEKILEESITLLEKDENIIFEIRLIRDLFVFTKSSKPEMTVLYLKSKLDTELVDIFNNGVKVYVVPKQLSKGVAIKRFKDYLKADTVIAAGDSEFDVSMLECADYAIAPADLEVNSDNSLLKISAGVNFSDEVLKNVLNISHNN